MEEVATQPGKCLFCDSDRELKPGCAKQRWKVCGPHFMVTCPRCGHNAFWLEDRLGKGRYVCFRVSPWCDWTSPEPPRGDEHVDTGCRTRSVTV